LDLTSKSGRWDKEFIALTLVAELIALTFKLEGLLDIRGLGDAESLSLELLSGGRRVGEHLVVVDDSFDFSWELFVVFKNMISEASMSSEFHGTFGEGANKWGFLSVGTSDMVLKGIISLEGLETTIVVTNERTRFGMCSCVTNNFGFVAEEFSTAWMLADKLFSVFFSDELEGSFTLFGAWSVQHRHILGKHFFNVKIIIYLR